MTGYISKNAIITEIESLKRITFTNFDEGVNCAAQAILEIINTLEVKEVDFEKEFHKYTNGILPTDIQFAPFTNLYKCAKYFFELGLKSKGE